MIGGMLRIAGLPVLAGPSDVLAAVRAVAGWTDEAVELVGSLPGRTTVLLDEVTALVSRINRIADRVEAVVDHAEGLVERVGGVAEGADALVTRAGGVADGAAGVASRAREVVEKAAGSADAAGALLAVYEPIAERAAPLARTFVDEFSLDELHAAIRLVDHLPQFTSHLERDIMPILATLDRVGPDVHELLEQLKEVRQAINGIPGFGFFRRRGEREDTDDDVT